MLRWLVFLLLIIAIIVYVRTTPIAASFSSLQQRYASDGRSQFIPPFSGPLIPAVYGPVTIEGEVWMDYANTYDGIPYIAYVNDRGRLATKQLVFVSPNGCKPAAGDLPCAPPGGWYDVPLEDGEPISVTGTIQADRLVVHTLVPR